MLFAWLQKRQDDEIEAYFRVVGAKKAAHRKAIIERRRKESLDSLPDNDQGMRP